MPSDRLNCSEITDDQLAKTLQEGLWIGEKGSERGKPIKIYYTFDPQSFWWDRTNLDYYYQHGIKPQIELDPAQRTFLENTYRDGFKKWSAASQGKLVFSEVTRSYPFHPRLISIHTVGSAEENQRKLSAMASTIPILSFDGAIIRCSILMPNATSPLLPLLPTILHELGHCWGLPHLHQFPDLLKKLRGIPSGQNCSVMPYPRYISGSKLPHLLDLADVGPLDKRFINIAYERDLFHRYWADQSMEDYLFQEGLQQSAASFSVAFIYEALFIFLCQFHFKNKPLFTENAANLILDGTFLGLLLILNFPLSLTGTFFLATACKFWFLYLEQEKTQEKPHQWKLLRSANILFFNLLLTYEQDPRIKPFILDSSYRILGHLAGSYLPHFISLTVNYSAKRCPGKKIKRLKEKDEVLEREEKDIRIPILERPALLSDTNSPSVAKQRATLFYYHPPRRVSNCDKLTRWLASKFGY